MLLQVTGSLDPSLLDKVGKDQRMNDTTLRETELRSLAWHIARTRSLAARQTIRRESAIREFGLGHPRAIAATRLLNRTMSAHRSLQQHYRSAVSDLGRRTGRGHRGSWEDHHQ